MSPSVGAHWGTWGVHWPGILEIVGGLRKGSLSLCGNSVRKLVSGDLEGYGEEGSGDGHHPMGGSVHRELWEIVVRGLWKWGICLYGSSIRGTWRGAHLLGALKVTKGRLWGWASIFMGAQLGNLEWVHLPGTLRHGWKGVWRWSVSLSPCGSSVKET
jgi:hypothetical protein